MSRRRLLGLALAAIWLLLLIYALSQWRSARSAKAEAKLGTGQAASAIQSGADAASTIGNRMDAEAQGDALTRENDNAIRDAEGADTPVAPAVRDAGLASLCRRAAHRRDPRCLQQADPR